MTLRSGVLAAVLIAQGCQPNSAGQSDEPGDDQWVYFFRSNDSVEESLVVAHDAKSYELIHVEDKGSYTIQGELESSTSEELRLFFAEDNVADYLSVSSRNCGDGDRYALDGRWLGCWLPEDADDPATSEWLGYMNQLMDKLIDGRQED